MKPKQQEDKSDDELVTGDVIGDTVYSERFVLKLLLKFANLDTLKDELPEKTFEEDLCTLWDMTTERDVVVFLQKHNALNLFQFTLPVISSQRIIEIIIGIIGNMTCVKEVVEEIFKIDGFLPQLLSYITSDDCLVLIQVFRLINYSLLLSEETQVLLLMNLFETNEYSKALYFILNNSLHKDLLINAFENMNTLCSQCNTEKTRSDFFKQFVIKEAIESLWAAFNEVFVNQTDCCEMEERERLLNITLQILLNLLGFDNSSEIYKENKKEVSQIVQCIVNYGENMLVDKNIIDPDLVHVIDSINTIKSNFELEETCDKELFRSVYRMWKTVKSYNLKSSDFENDEEIDECIPKLRKILSTFISKYMVECNKQNLLNVLDKISDNYDEILNDCEDDELRSVVSKKTCDYRSRIKDYIDS